MDLHEKIRTIPASPGCYLYKNAEGTVIYVGKAKNLRSRVRSYFLAANQANAKTGSLMREAVDVDYITVDNEREALALENNLIKQRKPRFNILLRDDKTYPYIKLTMGDRYPKVFVTRRLRKDGGAYFGPYFPGNLAHRLVDVIHRSFLIPSCKVDLSRYHPRACLQFYIKRCLGPCVEGLTTPDTYKQTIRDVQLFLEGRPSELEKLLTIRMEDAAANMQFELAARLRDQIVTVHQAQDKQRIATADNEDADVFGFHFENEMLAVNLFHMRGGKIVDRRDFFWEDLPDLQTNFGESLDDSDFAGETTLDSAGTPHFDHTPPHTPQPQNRTPQASPSKPASTTELQNAPHPDPSTNLSSRPKRSEVEGPASPDPSTNLSSRPERSEVEGPASPDPSTNLSSRPERSDVEGPASPDPSTNLSSRPKRSEVEGPASPDPSTNLSSRPKRSQVEGPASPAANLCPPDDIAYRRAELSANQPTSAEPESIACLEPDPTKPAPEYDQTDDDPESLIHRAPIQQTALAELAEAFSPATFFSALLKQLYLDQPYIPRSIYVPVDFPDRALLADLLSERTRRAVTIAAPQRGDKRSLVDLVCQNAKQSYDQRFRVLQPTQRAIALSLQKALNLPSEPKRIECFDISHIQGADTVASMVVWEDGAMKKSDYRKFQVKTVTGVDDFASMREIIQRRYAKLLAQEKASADPPNLDHSRPRAFPSLILIDGGLGQLSAAADALLEIGITPGNHAQPLASIAKREEIIYVYGDEAHPVVLDRRSPVLHVIQKIRDESHRFAVTYHRKRREIRDRDSELDAIPGVGPRTRQRLLQHFGSIRGIKQAAQQGTDALTAVVNPATAEKIRTHFAEANPDNLVQIS